MAALILPSRRIQSPQQGYTLNREAVSQTGTIFLAFPHQEFRDQISGKRVANPGGLSSSQVGRVATFNGSQQGNLAFPLPNGHVNMVVAARIRATATQSGTPGAAFGIYDSSAQGGFGVGFDPSNNVGLAALTSSGAYLTQRSVGALGKWYTVYAQVNAAADASGVCYVDGRPVTTSQGASIPGLIRVGNEVSFGAQHRSSGFLRPFTGDIEWAALMYLPKDDWQSLTDDVALRLFESGYPYNLLTPIQRRIWVPVAGGGGISQTVAFTLEDVSAAVSQNLSHAQSLTGTLDDVTVSISQTVQHSQALSATLDDIAFSASQTVGNATNQTLAITLDGVTVAAAQTLSHSQSLDAALDGVTVAASQTLSHSQALAATLDGITAAINQSAAPSSKDQSLAVTLDSIAVSIAQEGPASLIDTHDGFWAKEWARIRAREKRKYQAEVQERVEEIQDEIAEVEQQIVEVKQAPKPKKATPARDFYAEQARIVEHLIARRNQLIDEEDDELLLLL